MQITYFCQKKFKICKLLSMMTLNKMFYKVNTFSLKLSMLSYL